MRMHAHACKQVTRPHLAVDQRELAENIARPRLANHHRRAVVALLGDLHVPGDEEEEGHVTCRRACMHAGVTRRDLHVPGDEEEERRRARALLDEHVSSGQPVRLEGKRERVELLA